MIDELFSLKVSYNDLRILKRVRAIAVYLTGIALLISVTIFIFYTPRIREFFTNRSLYKPSQLLEVYSFLIYAIFFVVLFPLQSYFFFRFSVSMNKSVRQADENGLSRAIRWLLLYAGTCIITYTVNFLQFAAVLAFGFFEEN